MQIVDYLIIGQGISGTMLSWFLHKEGKSFIVLDEEQEASASRTAAGIINPVTGRRYVYTWMIDEVMPFAVQSYKELSEHLDSKFVFEKSIIDFFPSPDMRTAFVQSIDRNDTYLHAFPDQNHFNQYFHHEFGCGKIHPAYLVNVQVLMASWKKHLLERDSIRNERFNPDHLDVKDDSVTYQDITAQKIIFCDGIAGLQYPWFRLLPFAPNKGEALIIHSEELTNEHIFKNRLILAPLPVQHTYWVGSNYQWEFRDDHPSEEFLAATTKHLKKWLKVPFKVLFHKASVRPATVERRPFVGLHPRFPSIGILNGLGTKGTSLAPFFAHQLVQHLVHHFPITEEADVRRFARILSK
jgi:glycine/D-amino acid oxidase-like deaminating enzyme